MSDILDPPSTVLVVGMGDATPDRRLDKLRPDAAESTRTVGTADAATRVLSETDEVCCVLTAAELPGGSGRDLCRRIRDVDEDLPVVLSADVEDRELLHGALDAGVTDVVSSSATPEEIRAHLQNAIETYHQRLVTAEESQMLTAMLDSLGKSIYVKDRDLRIIHHADVGGGLDPETARGKTDLELYDDQESAREAYEDGMAVIEGKEIFDREERIQDADMWMRTTKVPWRDESGSVRGLLGHTIDITEYKRTERDLEELRHRFTTFTRQLQHDLKTQLQIAVGLLDRIEQGEQGQFSRLERTLDRIEQIVEGYDKLARRSIRIDDDMAPTNLGATIENARSVVDAGDVDIVVDVPAETYVNAPESMVQTVLVNLLRDATNHSRADGIVRLGLTSDGFYVEDDSGEVPEFKREVIEQTGYTSTKDGRGRELSIVKDQIERHIWTVALSERPDGSGRIAVENCLIDRETDHVPERQVEPDDRASVGTLQAAPDATFDENANRWSVSADGNDVYRQDNDFYFVHAAVDGPVSIQVKVRDVEHVDDYSKGGLMVRESLDVASTYSYLGKTPAFGTEVLWRSEAGTDGQSYQLNEQATLFDWYRLERRGGEVRMFLSMDGERWQEVERRAMDNEDPVHVGMAVCSMVPGENCEVVFEDLSIQRLDDAPADS